MLCMMAYCLKSYWHSPHRESESDPGHTHIHTRDIWYAQAASEHDGSPTSQAPHEL
jgi:hypothetical protein